MEKSSSRAPGADVSPLISSIHTSLMARHSCLTHVRKPLFYGVAAFFANPATSEKNRPCSTENLLRPMRISYPKCRQECKCKNAKILEKSLLRRELFCMAPSRPAKPALTVDRRVIIGTRGFGAQASPKNANFASLKQTRKTCEINQTSGIQNRAGKRRIGLLRRSAANFLSGRDL